MGETSAPAAPTQAAPTPKAAAYTLRTSVPITRAPYGLSAAARMLRPRSVRARNSQSAAVSAMARPKVTRRATSTKIGPIHTVACESGERTRAGIGTEGDQGGVLEHEGHPEHEEDLHLVGRVHDALDEPSLDQEPEEKEGGRADEEAHVGIDRPPGPRAARRGTCPTPSCRRGRS